MEHQVSVLCVLQLYDFACIEAEQTVKISPSVGSINVLDSMDGTTDKMSVYTTRRRV
jgi:hypothetical protein